MTLTDKVEGGRGVWEAAQGDLMMYEAQSSSWKVRTNSSSLLQLNLCVQMSSVRWTGWARSQVSSLCPPPTFLSGQETVEVSCH